MAAEDEEIPGRQPAAEGPDPRGEGLRGAAAQAVREMHHDPDADDEYDEAVPKTGPDRTGQAAVGNTGGSPGGRTDGGTGGVVGGPGTVGGSVGGTTTGNRGAVDATTEASDAVRRKHN